MGERDNPAGLHYKEPTAFPHGGLGGFLGAQSNVTSLLTCPMSLPHARVCSQPPTLPRGWDILVPSELNSPAVLILRREQWLKALGEEEGEEGKSNNPGRAEQHKTHHWTPLPCMAQVPQSSKHPAPRRTRRRHKLLKLSKHAAPCPQCDAAEGVGTNPAGCIPIPAGLQRHAPPQSRGKSTTGGTISNTNTFRGQLHLAGCCCCCLHAPQDA